MKETLLNYYKTMKCCTDPKSMAVVTTEFAEELNTEVQKKFEREIMIAKHDKNLTVDDLITHLRVSLFGTFQTPNQKKIDKTINKTVENWNKDNPKLKTLKEVKE